jgi:hypothetical protein
VLALYLVVLDAEFDSLSNNIRFDACFSGFVDIRLVFWEFQFVSEELLAGMHLTLIKPRISVSVFSILVFFDLGHSRVWLVLSHRSHQEYLQLDHIMTFHFNSTNFDQETISFLDLWWLSRSMNGQHMQWSVFLVLACPLTLTTTSCILILSLLYSSWMCIYIFSVFPKEVTGRTHAFRGKRIIVP